MYIHVYTYTGNHIKDELGLPGWYCGCFGALGRTLIIIYDATSCNLASISLSVGIMIVMCNGNFPTPKCSAGEILYGSLTQMLCFYFIVSGLLAYTIVVANKGLE